MKCFIITNMNNRAYEKTNEQQNQKKINNNNIATKKN